MDGSSYVYEIEKIDRELKRINAHAKNLRTQRNRSMAGLYNYMKSNNLEQVGSGKNIITIKKCAPKEKKISKLKPKAQRRAEALELFSDAGIPNPEQFYEDLERVQRAERAEQSEMENMEITGNKSKKKRNNKNDYDPLLGF
jgi:hypothetical protein